MVGPDRSTTTPSAVDLADAEDLQSAIANVLPAGLLAEQHRKMAEPGSAE